ncbi:RNA ligase-domain-containing protein [Mycena capillaripes]|nr:RNA ligase-domain-containing protein [Mycena capillaripes]
MSHPAAAEDSALIKELMDLSSAKKTLVRSSKYEAPADPNTSIVSWRMAEHKYYVVPSPFPTLARGIFSVKQPDGEHRIVARGYDKFFNIGEVGWTTWTSLEAHTTGPYTLSLKSNGCIIFIAALTPEKLLVTSKHAVGPAKGEKKLSHADAGEAWLRKYLVEKGRTEADLANVLWENNWTAVAELCDDSFEEHVLAYPPEMTGLHLHGLNESTKAFKTQPHATVDAFAAEWGFIQTASTELPSVAAVRDFTTEVGKTGAWNGVPVEGFVVRTQVAPPPPTASPRSAPPYPPGSSFFFKVKFDEPYMMYRDWREVTKTLLGMRDAKGKGKGKDGMSIAALPKSKMCRAETQVYARWVIEEIRRDPTAFAEYNDNKGIVAVRERFLAYLASDGGKKAMRTKSTESLSTPALDKGKFGKTIIVPVAIPGCGKTAVAIALSYIFGFGHTQSDDVNAKKAAPVFIKNVTDLLKKHDVVIADKNNHLQQHRQALRTAIASSRPPVRLLALNWAIDKQPLAAVHHVCAERIQQRGDKHQTLRPDKAKAHEDVLWTFLTKAEPLAPSEVDEVVDMELADGLEEAVARAVDACVRVLGVPPPAPATVQAALDRVRGYAPRAVSGSWKKTTAQVAPRYFALLPEIALEPLLAPVLADVPFWTALQGAGRVAQRPHVTLVHQNVLKEGNDANAEAAGAQEFWTRCKALHDMSGRPPLFRFRLGHVAWNERIMAVTVDGVELAEEGDVGQAGAEFVAQLPEETRRRLHITVGTRDANVPPVEAKKMVETWREAPTSAQSIPLEGVVARGRVKGLQN